MIWLQPWAWIGALAVAAPILVHLLAARRAPHIAFPTLRFLRSASVASVRRHRMSDAALLLVRMGVLLAVVAALARPYLLTAGRRHALGAQVVRAIIVDTSASMRRPTPTGQAAEEAARIEAARLSRESTVTSATTMEARDLRGALVGAAAWLDQQPGQHEVVVVSDFQLGALDQPDLMAIPDGTGIRLAKIDVAQGGATAAGPMSWPAAVFPAARPDPNLLRLAGPDERADADAAYQAALTMGVPTVSPARPLTIVFPRATERDALAARSGMLDQPWMSDVLGRLSRDRLLNDAARGSATRAVVELPGALSTDRSVVLLKDDGGRALVAAASASLEGAEHHRLVLFSSAEAGTVFSAALLTAAMRAASDQPPAPEQEPRTISDSQLRQWERAPTAVTPPAGQDDDESDGRWLWAMALGLLVVEMAVRRSGRDERVLPRQEAA